MKAQVQGPGTNQGQELDSIDLEWLELLLEAKKIGLTVNEIREFFR